MKKLFVMLCLLSLASLQPLWAEGLPDFTDIVEKDGATVVNISAITNAKPVAGGQHHPGGIPDNDPMFELFRRFGMPVPDLGPQEGQGETRSLGSGFIISGNGFILTNSHVVQGADTVTVTLQDKREFKAKVIGIDRKTDVAVLKIDASNLPTVRIGDPARARVGEWVVAIGSPFGFESTVTKGIISAKGRSLPQETLVPFIQTDVPINPGNSGGPLFNMKGEVIGINSQIYSRTGGFMGLSFAIPIDVALQVSDQLRSTGKVRRGWLGVVIQGVTRELADSFGLPKAEGALVSAVQKGSPAAHAGLQPSDIILKFDGKPIQSDEDLPRVVSATHSGSKVIVEVWRKGKLQEITLQVGEMPSDKTAQNTPATPHTPDSPASKLGLNLAELTPQQHHDLDLKNGVAVTDVQGPAAQAGLEPGDVILSINNNDVHSVEGLEQQLTEAGHGKMLAFLIRRNDGSNEFITLKAE